MKRNWFVIGAIFVFIIAYEVYVIRPYNDKLTALQKQTTTTGSATNAATDKNAVVASKQSVSNENKAAAGSVPVAQQSTLSSSEAQAASLNLDGAKTIQLTKERTLSVFSRGEIGRAILTDYSQRETKEKKPIIVVPNAYRWTSTQSTVQDCFSQLQAANMADPLTEKFSAQSAAGGLCQLSYSKSTAVPGLISVEMKLSGFDVAQLGHIEFSTRDDIGHGTDQDLKSFVYKVDGSSKWYRGKENLKPHDVPKGTIDFVAWGDKYFASVLLPKGQLNPDVWSQPVVGSEELVTHGVRYPLFAQAKEASGITYAFDIYFGPRDPELLAQIKPGLDEAVDLGWFASVSKAMLWCLKKLYTVFGNYGVAIIVLTLLVRLLFWPLNKKVYVSGLKMKAIQPEIEKLKAKYGDDKSKMADMNKELMGLYKTHQVNPLGSCLPLLLQMPIFIGLYGALGHSLDLYQAPFMGWVHDLSSKDPFYVFPILWTLSLFAYAKVNPAMSGPPQPGMPDMRMVNYGMNLLFGFLSKDWPAGLTLYLFVSNLVGIVQQVVLQRAVKLQPAKEGV